MAVSASPSVYRVLFWLSVSLFLGCFLAGGAYTLKREGHLPSPTIDVLDDANAAIARGDLKSGAAQYRAAARIDRGNYALTEELARRLNERGDASGELDQFLKARELWPTDPRVHKNLGWAFHHNQRLAEAVAAFDEALRLDPRYVDAWLGRGDACLDQEQHAEAERSFRSAVALAPGNAAAHNGLGIALAQEARAAEARAEFEEAVRLDPQPSFVQNLERARAESGRQAQ